MGFSKDECFVMAVSWFDTEDWLNAMITVLARREFRSAMAYRDRVREAASGIADDSQRARWVLGLTLVLDDEPLIVLDQGSGRGFRLSMSGVGDNIQLHTLLADRLIGPGRLDGERPLDSWVAAATTGVPGPFPGVGSDPIWRRFRLFDGHGAYVHPEGWPADIEPLNNGTRVLVLHPPRGNYGWTNGRTYEHAPARETDLMGAP
ncbi:hypothetical protein GCM10009839_07870 [Catenulispora yoronensis]|uniref:Uncharacterized protein n=1 Tax=Catenulispora yoronensis TaxID=450799 RepID=A0ABN2TP69_9ACTN